MSARTSSVKEMLGDDNFREAQDPLAACVAAAMEQMDPSEPPPAHARRWRWRRSNREPPRFDDGIVASNPLVRLRNSILATMAEQGAPEATLRRKANVLSIAIPGDHEARQMRVPGCLFEPLVVCCLTVTTGNPRSENGPHFNRTAIQYDDRLYNLTVSINEDADGAILTLRMTRLGGAQPAPVVAAPEGG